MEEYGITNWEEEMGGIEYAIDNVNSAIEYLEGIDLTFQEKSDLEDIKERLAKYLDDLQEVQSEYNARQGGF